jgi:hypothetical protein
MLETLDVNVELLFQHESAMAHTIRDSLICVKALFPGCFTSHSGGTAWPARSSDLSLPSYVLWEYLTAEVYKIKPHTLEELKQHIKERITVIDKVCCKWLFLISDHKKMYCEQERPCKRCNF